MSTTIYQSPEEISKICRYWVQTVVPVSFPGFVDDKYNSDLIHGYIQANHGGFYSLANLTKVAESLKSTLRGVGVAVSAQVKAQRAAEESERKRAEEAERNYAEQTQVVQTWLTRHCPEGLKCSNGEPFPGDQDRLVAFVLKNHGGKFSIDALNNAVEVLSPVLTWLSDDREIRNKPAPPPRKLSRQAQIDAGIIPAESERVDHSKSDGKYHSLEDLVKFAAKQELRKRGVMESPIMREAEAIVVQSRFSGKVDRGRTAEVQKIVIRKNGVILESETLAARRAAADKFERDKNQI